MRRPYLALTILRHFVSILILPFTMVVLVPRWILTSGRYETDLVTGSILEVASRIAGPAIFLLGFALFAWCISLFATKGKGTLAPWDPPREFVAVGPYRYMRNPMITGVCTMILGEALFFNSRAVAVWLLIFLAINQTYFMVLEEPDLERRFGEAYGRYKASVPRWIPRIRK